MLASHTPDQAIALVEAMGDIPQLRYIEQFVEGEKRIEVALLLHHTQLNPSTMPELMEEAVSEKLTADWETLSETLSPDLA